MVIGHVNLDRFKRDVFMPTTSPDGKPQPSSVKIRKTAYPRDALLM